MTASPSPSSDATRLVTPAMLVLWLVLATVPLWITRIGLYPYLGIEILIWSLYALAFNLVLGTAGLPSFGHGAYFGIGAYAFGLCQLEIVANLWICLSAAAAVPVLAVFAVGAAALWRLVRSPYGRVVAAIRQSEVRASHLGYNVWLYKVAVFALSAAVSGLAGGLFAMAQLAAFPDVMSLHQSGYVVMMTLVGGGLDRKSVV